MTVPGFINGVGELQALAEKPRRPAVHRAGVILRRHPAAEPGDILVRLQPQRVPHLAGRRLPRPRHQLIVERLQAADQRRARLAPGTPAPGAKLPQLRQQALDTALERPSQRPVGQPVGQPRRHAVEVRAQRRARFRPLHLFIRTCRLARLAKRSPAGRPNSDGPAPLVVGVEHVRLTELHPQRPPRRPFRRPPIDGPVDAEAGHLERDPLPGPPGDHQKGRADDADQVSGVPPAQVRLDLAAIRVGVHYLAAPLAAFRFQIRRRPWSVRSRSTMSIEGVSGAIMSARPPVATEHTFGPISFRIRATIPSTMPT